MKQGEPNRSSRCEPSRNPAAGARRPLRTRGVLCTALSVLLVAGAVACSRPAPPEEPRIDMTTDETAARSFEKLRASLTKEQRAQLTRATAAIVRHEVEASPEAMKDPLKVRAMMVRVLDGKTASQLIAEANALPKQGGGASPAAPKGAG